MPTSLYFSVDAGVHNRANFTDSISGTPLNSLSSTTAGIMTAHAGSEGITFATKVVKARMGSMVKSELDAEGLLEGVGTKTPQEIHPTIKSDVSDDLKGLFNTKPSAYEGTY